MGLGARHELEPERRNAGDDFSEETTANCVAAIGEHREQQAKPLLTNERYLLLDTRS